MFTPKKFVFFPTFCFFLCQVGIYNSANAIYTEGSIEFYGSENYEDLLIDIYTNTTTKCVNVADGNGTINVKSIRTVKCWIFYKDPDCRSLYTEKFDKYEVSGDHVRQIGSFHFCTEENGESNLNVDLTTFYGDRNEVPTILEAYKEVCSCHNIPEYVVNLDKWSVDNHGNDMVAYFEENCAEDKFKPIYIPPGHSEESREIYNNLRIDRNTSREYRIQSFGPNLTSVNFMQSCREPYEAIMETEFLEVLNSTNLRKEYELDWLTKSKSTNVKIVEIQFYDGPEFQGLLTESSSTLECTNLLIPTNSRNSTDIEIGSLKTTSCILIYTSFNCKGRSVKILPGEISNLRKNWEGTVTGPKTLSRLYKTRPNWKWTLNSFQICNNEEKLNVDITSFELRQQAMWESPYVWKKYRDVCSCQNIPTHLDNIGRFSINNYGNSVMAYFGENCTEVPLWIPAGRSSYSIAFSSLRQEGKVNRIQSFGPDVNSIYFRKHCLKMDGSVIKFEIDDKAEFEESYLGVDLNTFDNVFRNSLHIGVNRTYSLSKTVEERFQVEVDSSLETLSWIWVDSDFEVESNFDRNVFRELAFREVLRIAYSNSSNTTLNSGKTFSVKQVLNILPCTEYKLNAHVNMLRNDRMEFRALLKVSGYIGERKLSADEVKRFMDKRMEYKGNYDEYTVLAYAKGNIGMNFGTNLVIEGENFAILDCESLNMNCMMSLSSSSQLAYIQFCFQKYLFILIFLDKLTWVFL